MNRSTHRASIAFLVSLAACGGTASEDDAAVSPRDDAFVVVVDAPGLDAPGLDAFANDAAVVAEDAPLPDAPGLDAPFTSDTPSSSTSTIGELVSRERFEEIFLHRGTAPCRGAFYTYDAFLAAADTFPAFASAGDDATRRREVAAFLANIAHETTGGWDTAPDGRYAWGLCWITEGATVDPSALPEYCSPSAEWPCEPGQKYFGRGPMQLSWNYNYGQCGVALGLPLLTSPDLVASDPTIAFRTALWFWMTPQSPKPSCHDVMTGGYAPTPDDASAGRLPGFGLTVNIINGGLECGHGADDRVNDRIGFYERFTTLLGTTPGDNLDCASMRSF
ncbi:MAG: hypothetical protein J0L92_24065 [Deltaproteobacteria bacterium]|nr:hypothetical protein [Deltaproteobacteria bacterium]